MSLPGDTDRANHSSPGRITVYEDFLQSGLRFPLPTLLLDLLKHYQLSLSQLIPNSIRMLIGFLILCRIHTITPSVNLFRRFFTLRVNGKEPGWYGFAKRPTAATLIMGTPSSVHGWKPRYFFVSISEAADLPPWRDGEASIETDKPNLGFSTKDELTLSSYEYCYKGPSTPSEAELRRADLSSASITPSSKHYFPYVLRTAYD